MSEQSTDRTAAGTAGHHIVPAVSKRFILIHYHIFKNAGSTIEYALERTFGSRFTTLHGPRADSLLENTDITAFLSEHPNIEAISSHHLKYPKPVSPHFVFFDVCFLRDPLQRLRSIYSYMRRVEPVDELGQRAQQLDLSGFLELLVREHPQIVNDVQVNMVANGGVYTRPPSRTDLHVALDHLRNVSILGVVDLFDKSLVAAEYFLRPAFPRMQFQYVKQNVSPTDGDTGVFREPLKKKVDPAVYAHLRKMNELDMELLDYAKQEVFRRFELVPTRQQWLADFENRCSILRSVHEAQFHQPA